MDKPFIFNDLDEAKFAYRYIKHVRDVRDAAKHKTKGDEIVLRFLNNWIGSLSETILDEEMK